MTTLATDAPRTYSAQGDYNDIPIVATDIVYQGAAVGLSAGYARPLVAGDRFAGFSESKVDNATGAAGDLYVRTKTRGGIQLAVSGAAITDFGKPVYASDDATFSLSPVGGSFVGFVSRFVSSGQVIVSYDAERYIDPFALWPIRETISGNKTLDAQDTGKLFWVDTDAAVITLPATATASLNICVVNGGADGAVAVTLSPNASDKVMGPDIAGADDKDLVNTKATAKRGDRAVISAGHADGWVVTTLVGTWAQQA